MDHGQNGPHATDAGCRLTIDLDALARNWRAVAAMAAGAETAAVVKADGYGIGLEAAVRTLAGAGCRTFFVALPEEGRRARAAAPDAVIYVLGGLLPGGAATLAASELRPVLGSPEQIEEWSAWRREGGAGAAAIHVDTGMHRLGLSLDQARQLAADPDLLRLLAPALLMSHLACADRPDHPKNAVQRARFIEARELFPDIAASLANSAGVYLGPDYHFDLVRPGIALYGAGAAADEPPLATVVTAEARVLQLREAEPGETVGYGAAETLKRPSLLAVLAAGYADGYHRLAGGSDLRDGGRVFLRGRYARLVGRISMDLMVADVTDIPGVERDDWAELFGPNIPIDETADRAGTIGYEFLTGLGHRYHRRYLEADLT